MQISNNEAIETANLPTPSFVAASKEEVHDSKLRMIERIAPVVALSQVVFGIWFSLAYGSLTHFSGLLWLFVLLATTIPEILRLPGTKFLLEKYRPKTDLSLIRSIGLGVVWGIFPFFMSQIGSETEMLAVFLAQLTIISVTAIYLFTIPARGIGFLFPAVLGAAVFSSGDWFFSYSMSMAVFLLVVFGLTIGLGYIFTRQVAKNTHSELAIIKREKVIGLLLAEANCDGHSEWLLELDKSGKIMNSSRQFLKICGLSDEKFESLSFVSILEQLSVRKGLLSDFCDQLDLHEVIVGFEIPLTISGSTAHWSIAALPTADAHNRFTGHIILVCDKTNERNAEEERSRLALSDPLTGLMNRARFSKEIEKETAKLERYGINFTLMFLDLDKFKLVNDMRGHLVGDKLLKMVSERILKVVRETDSVARLGGDEFAVLMRDDCDAGSAARLAAQLIQNVSRKYEIDGEFHTIGVSIGIALAPLNGTRPNQILRNADLALYRSKADGRGVFRFFESQMDADQREKRMLELELREALDQGQFELFYQPLISTSTGLATGMEALIRWNHPIRGRVSPDEFMPIAEQTSLIQEIGNWTIKEACATAMEWPEDLRISINLSAQHLIGSDIVKITEAALAETKLSPQRLELEITESLFINNAEEAAQLLNALKRLGVAIVLDDFGTGYSSLSYILKFPFDKIKIDRSFVIASSDDSAARAILRMISGLGEQLGIRITAEGVETREQVEFLHSIKCDEFQGFFFAKPLAKSDLDYFFSNQKNQTTPANDVADKMTG
ncbi:MAG: putative bifunctional diguanylate cyclase/phosphodiesterase [Rhizobiaceae bacterium]